MKQVKIFIFLSLTFLLTSATPTILNEPEIMIYAQNCLPHHGVLEKTEEGFVYVKVSDEYIYEILNRLGDEEAVAPPYFGEGKVGAHITVMEASEGKKLNIPQLGSTIAFDVVDFAQVEVVNKKGTSRIYMLIVDAPELKKIRTENGLSPKNRGHAFHITTAIHYYLEVEAAS
jgi:hypothetical protein